MDKNKKNWKNWLACFRIPFESEHPSIVWAHYAEKQQRLCDVQFIRSIPILDLGNINSNIESHLIIST